MFKRVERRIRKKEKEEDLGLDEETKEMLGLNAADTDSEESDSSLDSDDEGQEPGGEEDDGEDDMEHVEGEESEQGLEEEDEGAEDEVLMSVSEALQNPLWHVSLEPEVKACAVCPGKLLKNPVMIDVHLKSGAHKRRFAKLREDAMGVDPETEVRDLVRAQRLASQPEKPAEGKLSKRAEKKKAKLAAVKAKRAKQKVMKARYRARKEAKEKAAAENDSGLEDYTKAGAGLPKSPTAKKRKVDEHANEEVHTREAASSSEKKHKPPKTPAASKPTRKPTLASAKIAKASKLAAADTPSGDMDELKGSPTVQPKRTPTTKSAASPIKALLAKESKLKKRKRSEAVS